MRFVHLADLHIGKKVNDFSMIEDQEYILLEILKIIKEEKIDAVFIAGDVYDKSVPSAEAVRVFDDFLSKLASFNVQIFVISGNHDSAERIAFGARIMNSQGVFLSPVYHGKVEPTVIKDSNGDVSIYMLPFVKPANVRAAYEEEEIISYNDSIKVAVSHMKINPESRNILIAHQFVTGAQRCESEDISVGGIDNVDGNIFEEFDYVALGHIHGPQHVLRPKVRYCGSPLKYSFSEANHKKSVTIVDVKEKGKVEISTIPLIPKRDLIEIKGKYMELTAKQYYENLNREDYYHVTLTDEEDIMDALAKLRVIYPNIMKLDYENTRTKNSNQIYGVDKVIEKTPIEHFDDLYKLQNNQSMNDQQRKLAQNLIEKIWEV